MCSRTEVNPWNAALGLIGPNNKYMQYNNNDIYINNMIYTYDDNT